MPRLCVLWRVVFKLCSSIGSFVVNSSIHRALFVSGACAAFRTHTDGYDDARMIKPVVAVFLLYFFLSSSPLCNGRLLSLSASLNRLCLPEWGFHSASLLNAFRSWHVTTCGDADSSMICFFFCFMVAVALLNGRLNY